MAEHLKNILLKIIWLPKFKIYMIVIVQILPTIRKRAFLQHTLNMLKDKMHRACTTCDTETAKMIRKKFTTKAKSFAATEQ